MAVVKNHVLDRSRESPPLYIQLKNIIVSRISSGEFSPGDRLPSEADLVSEYGVSRITVVRVLTELASEGMVVRHHGKGTYAREKRPEFRAEEIVGAALHTTGHLHAELTARIIRSLQRHKYYCALLDCQVMEKDPLEVRKLRELIDRNPAFLIADGYSKCRFEILKSYRGRLIFIHVFENDGIFPGADYVLSDFRSGARLAAGHFLENGFDRLLIYLREYHKSPRRCGDIISGAGEALMAKGLPPENAAVLKPPAGMDIIRCDDYGLVSSRLEEFSTPAAVLCDSDSAAKSVYRYAREKGLRIPGDISVMGWFNTPWSSAYEPALSSVSVREKVIAGEVVKRILNSSRPPEKIMVEPELILRDSC